MPTPSGAAARGVPIDPTLSPMLSRRGFTLAGLAALAGWRSARAAPCAPDELVYIGSDATHLHALRFDACAGTLSPIGAVAALPKPRWAVAHPQRPLLYVANEGQGGQGAVTALAVDRRSGALTPVGEVDSGGAGPTHLWLDAPSMTLLVANFGGGSVASLPIAADGRLAPAVSTLAAQGSGPHRRQASAHAHGVTVDASGRFVLVADLGADRVFVYGFDRATHALSGGDAAAARQLVAPPGSGPRRLVFGADGRFAYRLDELTAQVQTLRWDAAHGRLAPQASSSLSSEPVAGRRSASELMLGPDGRFAYVADRGEHTLLVFSVDPASGELGLLQRLPSGGESPWAFAIHRSGTWLLVANRGSERLNLFRIDSASGRLSDTGQSLAVPAPVSVAFVN